MEDIKNDIVGMSNGYAYVIHRRNEKNDEIEFFRGFYNQSDHIGTEDECQCWENEGWCDNEEDAFKFPTFDEAKAAYLNLEENRNCLVTMYGKGVFRNFSGTYWYPLKTFMV